VAGSNEADRVAAERAANAQRALDQAESARVGDKRAEISDLARRAAVAVPMALATLARAGYPGLEQVAVYVPRGPVVGRLLGKDRLTEVGAYATAPYSVRESSTRPASTEFVRLLSNGRLAVGSRSNSIDEFAQQVMHQEGAGDGRYALHNLDAYRISTLENVVSWLELHAQG
jgi:hypothetical protein